MEKKGGKSGYYHGKKGQKNWGPLLMEISTGEKPTILPGKIRKSDFNTSPQ